MSEEKNLEHPADAERAAGAVSRSGKPQKPVYVYLIALFAVALLLMSLSFFMSHRSNQQVIGHLQQNTNSLQLLQESEARNAELSQRIIELEDEISQQNKTIFELQQEIYDLQLELAIRDNADDSAETGEAAEESAAE